MGLEDVPSSVSNPSSERLKAPLIDLVSAAAPAAPINTDASSRASRWYGS